MSENKRCYFFNFSDNDLRCNFDNPHWEETYCTWRHESDLRFDLVQSDNQTIPWIKDESMTGKQTKTYKYLRMIFMHMNIQQ